jgi:hypothetical protein
MAGQVPARMTVSRVFLRIAFRSARLEALERDPASALEPFHRRFRGFEMGDGFAMLGQSCSLNRTFGPVGPISLL